MKPRINDGLFSLNSDNGDFGVANLHWGHGHQPTPDALEFRAIDGSQNNLAQPDLNSAGTDFARVGPAHFEDGFRDAC